MEFVIPKSFSPIMSRVYEIKYSNPKKYKNQKIEIVREYNYLGVKLDDRLTMQNHINKSVNKANKKLYMIYKIRRCLA